MKMKRTFSLLLTLCLLLALLPGIPAKAAWSGAGDGTSENPYQIGTKAELKKFRDIVNGANGETQNLAAHAVLTADIDLENEAWTPIGADNDFPYIGDFDGRGHSITGLNVNCNNLNSGSYDALYAGLFGYVGDKDWTSDTVFEGTVRNVSVSGSVTAESSNQTNAGGIAGFIYYGKVENCSFTGPVSATHHNTEYCFSAFVGGIAGDVSNGTVQNCFHSGTVTGVSSYNVSVGGVVGLASSSVTKNCAHVSGAVSGTADNGGVHSGGIYGVGGAVGENINNSTVQNCYSLDTAAADVVGQNSATITGCGALTAAQMKDPANFSGWDFNTVWYMGANGPKLWAFATHVSTWTELGAALNAGGGIVLTADVTPDNPYWAYPLAVPSGVTATLDLNGHVVDRGYTADMTDMYGSAFSISGTLTLTDSDPDADHNGAVAYTDPVTGGTVEVTGGVITGGFNDQFGGGVYITGGTFNMKGGTIVGNCAGKNGFGTVEGLGGGVYVQSGSFNMSGGAIVGNRAVNKNIMVADMQGKGGGVFVNSGAFTFTGGIISGNEAGRNGGGVYIASAYSNSDGKINVSGDSAVTGNALNGAAGNVYLEGGGVITVTGPLTGDFGVTMQTPGVFTSGLSGNGTADNFTSDDAAYDITLSGAEASLLQRETTPAATFTATGPDTGTLSDLTDGAHYTVSGAATADFTLTGATSYDLTGVSAGTLSVVQKGDGTNTLDSASQAITVTKAATPDLTPTQPAVPGGTGSIPTTSSHEFSTDGTAWEACTGPRTDLAPGTYYVRTAASGSELTSDAVALTLKDKAAAPELPAAAVFSAGKIITITCATDGASIYYTTDGSDPTAASTLYAGPFTVSDTTTVKAIAVKDGMTDSDVASASYIRYVPTAEKTGSLDNFKAEHTYTEGMLSDVSADAWYAENVKAAVEYGLLVGRDDGTFGVGDELKVSEAVTIAARLHSIYYGGSGEFEPAADGPWYQAYTDYAEENGFLDPAQYDMDAPITRAQFAAIVSAALPDEALTPINRITALPDVPADDPNFAAILRLYNAGILTGMDASGSFGPDLPINREQIAAIATRVANPALRISFSL